MDSRIEHVLVERYGGQTVLAIGAHPDDVELAVGGTVARWSAACRVVIAVVSIPGDYPVRRREAERAAHILGCELRVLLDGNSKRIEDLKSHELVRLLDEQVKELSPAAVLAHGRTDFHRDHVLVHDAAVCSQRLQHFDCFSYQPNFCRPVQMSFSPCVFVDVSGTIETKMAAIAAHESQFSARGIETDIYREAARLRGVAVGVAYAEGLEIERMLIC